MKSITNNQSINRHDLICEAVRVRSERLCGRPIGLSRTDRTLGEAMRLAVKSVRRPRGLDSIAQCVRGRSASHTASHFGLSDRSHEFVVRGRARPRTASHGRESPIGLPDRSHDFVVRGRARPPTAVRVRLDSGRSNAFSREISQTDPRIRLHRPVCVGGRVCERLCSPLIGSDRSHEKMWEAEAVGGRIWEAMGGRVGGRAL